MALAILPTWSGAAIASNHQSGGCSVRRRSFMSAVRLTDAIYDDGYVYSGDYDAWKKRPLALSPIAAAMAAHCREFARARVLRGSRNKVPLHPQALDDAIAYARERVAILTEVDKALKGRMARNLRAWRRLLGLLEAEGEKVAA